MIEYEVANIPNILSPSAYFPHSMGKEVRSRLRSTRSRVDWSCASSWASLRSYNLVWSKSLQWDIRGLDFHWRERAVNLREVFVRLVAPCARRPPGQQRL